MEFNFNITDIFNQPIVEINRDLIPPGFRCDRRTLWNTVNKVSEVVNAIGAASATAQGLPKPITTSERLKNSDHKLYLLIDQNASGGRGAVTGMLRTGSKGLYVFDKEGQHYQVSPPCVLDFYIHESSQRKGLGKHLFQHMLHNEQVDPGKMAIDRPSDKLMCFLNKHYGLNSPMKQMNNYVVFDGFFPKRETQIYPQTIPTKSLGLGRKESANGLQSRSSPFGRYGASRPTTSVGKLLHNDLEDRPRIVGTLALNDRNPITHVEESCSIPYYSHQSGEHTQNQNINSFIEHQKHLNQPVAQVIPQISSAPNYLQNNDQEVNQGCRSSSYQNVNIMNQQNQNRNLEQCQLPNRSLHSLPEMQTQNHIMYHQQQNPNNLGGMQSHPEIRIVDQVYIENHFDAQNSSTNAVHPQTTQVSYPDQVNQQHFRNHELHAQVQGNVPVSPHRGAKTTSTMNVHNQQIQPQAEHPEVYSQYQISQNAKQHPQLVSNNNSVGISQQNLQNSGQSTNVHPSNPSVYTTQDQLAQEIPQNSSTPEAPLLQVQMNPKDTLIRTDDSENQPLNKMPSRQELRQTPELLANGYGDFEKQQMPIISEERNHVVLANNIQNTSSNYIPPRTGNSQTRDDIHEMLASHQNPHDHVNFARTEQNHTPILKDRSEMSPHGISKTAFVSYQNQSEMIPGQSLEKSSTGAANISPYEIKTSHVANINPLDSRNMSNPNYISQVQYNPPLKISAASRTTVPMEEGVLEYGYPPQLSKAQALHFQKPDVMGIH